MNRMALALVLLLGCGDDDASDAAVTPDARTDAAGDADTGPDGARLGCANGGTACSGGQMCCSGVPYPPEGACNAECNLDSDRERKTAFAPIARDELLERVRALPIQSWRYREERPNVRHIGPMAQDFHESFGVGADERHIHPVDGIGVSLAAIQALADRVERLERENVELRRRLER